MFPNNDVLIIGDHASNDTKFMKPEKSEESLMRSSEAFDPGSADLVSQLSERLQCMAVLTNFSKLLVDPAVPICNQDLIRLFYNQKDDNGDLKEISLNNSGFRLWERLADSYLEYQKVLNEVMLFLDQPKIIVSIHSHESLDHSKSNITLYRPWLP